MLIQTFQLLFFPIVSRSLLNFGCERERVPSSDLYFLASAPYVQCSGRAYSALFLVSLVVVVIVVGLCLALGVVLSKSHSSSRLVATLLPLAEEFKHKYMWFVVVFPIFQVCIAAVLTTPPGFALAPSVLYGLTIAYVSAIVTLSPFSSSEASRVHLVSGLSFLLLVSVFEGMGRTQTDRTQIGLLIWSCVIFVSWFSLWLKNVLDVVRLARVPQIENDSFE